VGIHRLFNLCKQFITQNRFQKFHNLHSFLVNVFTCGVTADNAPFISLVPGKSAAV
jgi:hypothetical protein